jgi:malate dehydrogenase (oxaloacetate-decarboxylating)(NADP+)
MAAVDIDAIEAQMKMAALDTLKGYSSEHYGTIKQYRETDYIAERNAGGYQVLREPAWNKGTYSFAHVPNSQIQKERKSKSCTTNHLLMLDFCAGTSFSPDERLSKNLTGLIPHVLESLETQCMRAMRMINSRGTNIDKYLYLSTLKQNNTDLFYRLLIDNVATLMPLVYTPTIGDVCLQYSTLYTHPEALYISIKQRKSIATILKNWPYPEPSICVVTDGSRILGLGDLGVNGVGISVSRIC